MNLVSRFTIKHAYTRHFLNSILLQKHINLKSKTIVDFGSGAGFPGIPLKILYPSLKLYLIESKKKKTLFLKYLIEKLDLENCIVLRGRFEALSRIAVRSCDLVVVRAVKMSSIYFKTAFDLLQSDGKIILYQSKSQDLSLDRLIPAECDFQSKLITGTYADYGEYKFLIIERK